MCFAGYAGTACEACADGFAQYAGGCQAVSARAGGNGTAAADASSDAVVSTDAIAQRAATPLWAWLAGAGGAVALLVCVLGVLCCCGACACCRRRRRRRHTPSSEEDRTVHGNQVQPVPSDVLFGASSPAALEAARAHVGKRSRRGAGSQAVGESDTLPESTAYDMGASAQPQWRTNAVAYNYHGCPLPPPPVASGPMPAEYWSQWAHGYVWQQHYQLQQRQPRQSAADTGERRRFSSIWGALPWSSQAR